MTQQFPQQPFPPYQSPVPPKRKSNVGLVVGVFVGLLVAMVVAVGAVAVIGARSEASDDNAKSVELNAATQANAVVIASKHCETAGLNNDEAWRTYKEVHPGSRWWDTWTYLAPVGGETNTWRFEGHLTEADGITDLQTFLCDVAYMPGEWTATVKFNGHSGSSSQRVG